METNKQERKRDPKTGRFVSSGTSELARLRREVAELKELLAIKTELEEARTFLLSEKDAALDGLKEQLESKEETVALQNSLIRDKDERILNLYAENERLKNRSFWARVFNE